MSQVTLSRVGPTPEQVIHRTAKRWFLGLQDENGRHLRLRELLRVFGVRVGFNEVRGNPHRE